MPLTFNPANIRIGIIGLGYVGLPLAVEFSSQTTKRSRNSGTSLKMNSATAALQTAATPNSAGMLTPRARNCAAAKTPPAKSTPPSYSKSAPLLRAA